MYNISPIDTNTLSPQTFSRDDAALMQSFDIPGSFNPSTDVVEYFIYDFNNNLLSSNYSFNQWTNTNDPSLSKTNNISTLNIDPIQDLSNQGYIFGKVKSVYNFISNKLGSSNNNRFYISEISSNRTEIRLASNFISNESLQISYDEFKKELNDANYFDEFYLNFGNNNYFLAVNILLDTTQDQYSLLIKLYEPLPTSYKVRNELFVVVKSGESIGYAVEYDTIINLTSDNIQIQPPNFNIEIQDVISPSTLYKNYNSITSTPLSGSYNQLLGALSGSKITLTTDYTNYSDFVFFSSAYQRLYNFREKLYDISSSQAQLDLIYSDITGSTSSSSAVSSSKNILENQIQSIITNFDNYEKYLYYESGSYTWPKSNSVKPYTLYDVNSVTSTNWYATQSAVASTFDEENQNNLEYAVPGYLRDSSDNDNYIIFVNMVGQLFDEIWIYTKALTDKLDSNNSLDVGVSKDMVADVLKSLGTKLYTSNFTAENIYNSLLGYSNSGSLLLPTGSELITNYVTSSASSSLVPTIDDFNKLTYKKLYHNLPYLVKTKGTLTGLRALITTFGIPDTILRINEFGSKDKINTNDWDYWQRVFDYSLNTSTAASAVSSSWGLNGTWSSPNDVPASLQFRFKLPSSGSAGAVNYAVANNDTVLWSLDDGSNIAVVLEYTGSGFTSGSYSGSIVDPFYQYGTLKFTADGLTTSASVYLPFYNGNWWSVMVTRDSDTFALYAADSIYDGFDGAQIGFIASSSLTDATSETNWVGGTTSYFSAQADSISLGGNTYIKTSGSYQEVRYYTVPLNIGPFQDYVMNPQSIEGNGVNTAPDQLAFRASLGGELYTGSVSIHPKVTGSWTTINSFTSDSDFYINGSNFVNNYEYIFFDQIPAGIQNAISNKISTKDIVLPTSSSLANIPNADVISNLKTIQQYPSISGSYTGDTNYLEVAFSPQNEINEDINSSLGYFNIGEYIGDPRLVSSSAETYPALDTLRNQYFEKYTKNFDYVDMVRLIKYFDNSLFKMIKDYVPARSSLASGIVIKQHLLERNKYPTPQLDTQTTTSFYSGSTWNSPFTAQDLEITGSITVDNIYTVTGSNGGTMPDLGGVTASRGPGFNISPITQSWTGINDTVLGLVPYTASSQHEFFDGELSGSILTVTTQSLNPGCDIFLTANTVYVSYSSSLFLHSLAPEFLNANVVPPSGELYLLYDSGSAL